jgi:alkanesulfonate monooxygenase SsuD/methylene tetrahydromethanopterin reductase-like flavin-dependent oxidoreductase (luciferase family)
MKLIMMNIPQVPGDKRALRPIGRNADAYQAMLREVEQLVKRADELGVFGFGTAEHHLHTEGYEVMSAPMILYARLAAMTKNIKFIPLSLVPVASNPIRIAEEVAMFDQLFPGRIEVGFARGYQSRWLQVLAQDDCITSGVPGSDARNREIFNEYVEVVKLAWTQDNFSFNGKHFKVPFPYEGISGYPAVHVANMLGGDGESEDGKIIHKVGVVPPPLTTPHPPLWVPFTFSPQTLANAATQGYRVLVPASKPDLVQQFCRTYQELSTDAGHKVALGQNICALREIAISESPDEAFELATNGISTAMFDYYQYFGLMENWRTDADDPDKPVILDSLEAITRRLVDEGYLIIGNAGEVTEQLDSVRTCYGAGGNMEYLAWQGGLQGAVPTEVTLRQLEILATEVMPQLA